MTSSVPDGVKDQDSRHAARCRNRLRLRGALCKQGAEARQCGPHTYREYYSTFSSSLSCIKSLTGILSEGEIASATREVLAKQCNARVLLGEVTDIYLAQRRTGLQSSGWDESARARTED